MELAQQEQAFHQIGNSQLALLKCWQAGGRGEGGRGEGWLTSDKITSGPLSTAPPSCFPLECPGCSRAARQPVTCDSLPAPQLLNREQALEMFIPVCLTLLP